MMNADNQNNRGSQAIPWKQPELVQCLSWERESVFENPKMVVYFKEHFIKYPCKIPNKQYVQKGEKSIPEIVLNQPGGKFYDAQVMWSLS